MRKLKLNPLGFTSSLNGVLRTSLSLFIILLFVNSQKLSAQCTPTSQTISGKVVMDIDFNAELDLSDPGAEGVLVLAYDATENLVAEATTDASGQYLLSGLVDGTPYRIEFVIDDSYAPVASGESSTELLRFVIAPACQSDLLIHDPLDYIGPDPKIAVSKFIQGISGENDNSSTLMSVDYDFETDKNTGLIARKAETGSVWGMAYSRKKQKLFTSAFVKQYAELGPGGIGAIYQSIEENGQFTTSIYLDLVAAGVNLGQLSPINIKDCSYGVQTGRVGIGGMDISDKRDELYAINIYNHSLLIIPSSRADAQNISEIALPTPNCADMDYAAFAVSYHDDKVYVGITCTAETSQNTADLVGHIYEYDLTNQQFTHIFDTDYLLGYWRDWPETNVDVKHWLTDITFTDEGNMIISLSDRTGHRFCFGEYGRLDVQNGDVLVVWNDNGTWKLESNGQAGSLTGTGVGNGEGPGGGEFFAGDAWPKNPALHAETAIGSAFVLEGSGEVIVPVYDPENSAYSGGLKKFNTKTGEMTGVTTIYQHKIYPEFGKAAGFGELALLTDALPVEAGNYVWLDEDKDGVQDADEGGIEGMELSLYDTDCNMLATTVTDADGYYRFFNLNVDQSYYIAISDADFNEQLAYISKNGMNLYPTLVNKGSGTQKELSDSDAETATNICSAFEGRPFVAFSTDGSGYNKYDIDFGLSDGKIFDLALTKKLVEATTITGGDTIGFELRVYNQGTEPAREIVVVDYLPAGFDFQPSLNPGWKAKEGKAKYKFNEIVLYPGEEIFTIINLIVVPDLPVESYNNGGEISAALDYDGNPGDDIDSVMDEDPTNDAGGVPNVPNSPNPGDESDDQLDGDGTNDEDDHDVSWARVFDLALKKTVFGDKDVFLPGENVIFEIKVYNQGNEAAKAYVITDYLPEGLEFLAEDNTNWTVSGQDMISYQQNEVLYPNAEQTVYVSLKVKEGMEPVDIVNYAEISAIEAVNFVDAIDFDSTPNTNKMDDVGGVPGTETDNQIYYTAHTAVADEDDADPAMIHIHNFDLALRKTANPTNAKPGGLVHYQIEVFNQGNIPADEITVVDYLPDGLLLEDSDWTVDPIDDSKILYTASIANGNLPLLGLTGGESVVIELTCRVDAAQPYGLLTNTAEIKEAYDITGNNFGIYDEDSRPDDDNTNDNGGQVNTPTDNEINDDGTIDEDDADPAQVYISNVSLTADCICMMNASNPDDGEFTDEWTLTAPSGQNWRIASLTGITNLNPGDALIELPSGGTYSNYTLMGVHVDGLGYSVVFENDLGDQEYFEKAAGSCVYEDMIISGPEGTCGGEESYIISNPDPAASYQWSVSGANNVFVGSSMGTEVVVDWLEAIGGPYVLSVQNVGTPNCQAPNSLDVQIGSSSGSLVSRDELIASVDQNCEIEVTAEMILTFGYNPDAPYRIVLLTPDGEMLPSNVITSEYLNIPLMVKLKDLCGGNTAMSVITAIDKLPPSLDCSDEVVACDQLDSWTGPVVLDNCDPDAQAILIDEVIENEDCNSTYSQRIEQTYVAVDASGNQSEPCVKTIYVDRANTNEIDWPDNLLMVDNNALVCGAYPMCPTCDCDTFPYPDPVATGVPMLNGESIYPGTLGHCQFIVGFTDFVMVNTPCYKMVSRYWSVHEICDDVNVFNIINYRQDIEIIDNIPPIPVAPNNITMTTDGESCGNRVELPALEITDNCTSDFKVDITYPGGFIEDSNGASVWIPAGEHTVWYTIYDECDNYSQVEMKVSIEDLTPPVAICQTHTTVSLTNDGFAEVPAYVFDSGSYDDCTIVNMEVMRMEEGSSCEMVQNEFGPSVTFCCDDVGNTITVVLRVYDDNGNWSECMVDVEVQDMNAPVLTVPEDISIECTDYYDVEDLSPFGIASVYDVCGADIDEDVFPNINQCGTGYIDRVFTADDGMNIVTDIQRITIVNTSPFDSLSIIWPQDYLTANSCDPLDLSPQNLEEDYAFPKFIDEDQCDQLGFNFSDEIFPIEEEGNACYKIVRTWRVMDWCQFDAGEYKTWAWDQIIMVSNTVDPEIVTDLDPLETCTYDQNCEEGFIEIQVTGDDDCTPGNNLYWAYAIDLDQDGKIDIEGTFRGATLDLSAVYPIGSHTIYYTLADYCGNKTVGIQDFTIKNCKKPTAVCIQSLAVAIQATDLDGDGIPDTENAFVEAIDFDGGSYHSCGYPLKYSFSIDTSDYIMWVDCDDVRATGIQVTLYVTDIFGNYDFCETTLFVQDNNDDDICDSYTDCVLYPEAEVSVESCDPDLSPEGLNSSMTVDGDCPCQDYDISFVDMDISPDNSTCTVIQRDWTISFDCGLDKIYTFQQIIEVKNVIAPELICAEDIVVDGNANCEVFVNVPLPVYDDGSCNTGLVISHDSPYADNSNGPNASGTYPVGTTTVTFTLEDDCGNQSTCSLLITVNDVTPPSCVTNDITLQLESNGTVSITVEDIDGGSSDACGIESMVVEPNLFDCGDVGDNTVTLTVYDINGLSSTCTAIVSIEDENAELCSTQDIEIILDENGFYSLNPEEIYTGSACGGLDVTLEVDPASFDCGDLGENVVTLTVTESNGNSESCDAIVTVSDTIAPECQLLDIDAYLDQNGEVVVTFEDIDDGSFDPCGELVDTLFTDVTFGCGDVGEQTLSVTFTDNSGNSTDCECTVTVIDSIAPLCMTNDLVVQIGENGEASISAEQIDAGSTDECGIAELSIDLDLFTCSEVGDNVVILTVTDVNGNSSTCTATVTVEDESGPLCSTQDIDVILDGNGMYTLDPEEIYTGSPCGGGEITLEVTPDQFDCENIGDNLVELIVTDGFGNMDTCEAMVTVSDTIAPDCNVVDINAYLDANGEVSIDFEDINDGTVDQCGIIIDTTMSQNDFTCADIGEQTVDVTLTDNSGNVSTCTSIVTVLDTVAPICIADDVTIALDEFGEAIINGETIDGGSFDQCSMITLSVEPDTFYCNDVGFIDVTLTVEDASGNISECDATIEVVDIIPPEITCPPDTSVACTDWPISDYSVFGEASAFDECAQGAPITETLIEAVNDCGIGIVTRTFSVEDNSGNVSTCTQIITFNPSDQVFGQDNIFWGPATIETDNCQDLDPILLGGAPTYMLDNVDCYFLSEVYEDFDLNPESSCPDSIQRVWTVVDSCQYNETTGEGSWTFNQNIIVIDTVPPEIFGPSDTLVCGDGYIELLAYATDCGLTEGVDATNDSNFADSQASGDASGDYIVGEYDITITAVDSCANTSEYTYHLTVLDEFGECIKITRNIDDNGEVILHLDEIFIQNTECFDTTVVTFSLDIDDIDKDTLHFNCNDLGDLNNIDIVVPIFRWENGNFIEEYCDGTLTLFDPFGFCDDSGMANIGGGIQTYSGVGINDVIVELSGSVNTWVETDDEGLYAFSPQLRDNYYVVDPGKNDDVLNGVSTLDLIHIQRHLLGVNVFDEPTQYLAADVNASGSISAGDLFELRKVLLGIEENFSNQDSWQFIPEDYEFQNPDNPLNELIPDRFVIEGLNKNHQVNFKGIKIGDVNGSIFPDKQNLDGRSDDEVALYSDQKIDEISALVEVPVILGEERTLNGLQFTVQFAADKLEFVGLESSEISVSDQNIGLNKIQDGYLTFSWHDTDPLLLTKDATLFSFEFKMRSNAKIQPVQINSTLLKAEWYSDDHTVLDINWRTGADAPFTLYQNRPNPWANNTEISFMLPQDHLVTIDIVDIYGTLIKRYQVEAHKGLNTHTIDQSDFDTKGLLIVELNFNGQKQTRKMIKIN